MGQDMETWITFTANVTFLYMEEDIETLFVLLHSTMVKETLFVLCTTAGTHGRKVILTPVYSRHI